MWTRQVILIGASHAITLPPDITRDMQWHRGDVLVLQVLGPNKVQLSKLNPPRDVEIAQGVADIINEPHGTGNNS